ncbi:hypothetical protein ASG37_02460 [Sphingomonas sp. Leaf407]|uniref:RcnB family protein n=1 Tax=unclassified Sphingomonas TaxID=196159 RepID=UPI0006F73405|nr:MULTISPECIES: RcnB family protein [unclassified Sphingomonas]KQN40666.1 hypothetical protein ASE97_02485 [Sphingomonas sp. Leaf42]KQT30022.1 hypothetical protein ASG37_02460 [Sphingomonas sp. Leaf407]
MRTPLIAATIAFAAATALPTGVADAQVVAHGQRGHAPRMVPGGHPRVNLPGPRWGGKVRGRWYGGHYAPGGWNAYRQPARGWIMPRYWVAPSFYVQDWSTYGLAQPQAGYGWYRYYDDAVLADRDGRVYDYRGGIDWDARDDGRYVRDDRYYDDRYEGERVVTRRDNGVGGAVIGGVVGGVAGNVIAGRGNRLGGTILGAGVGALAGTAIDRAEDRGRRMPPPPPEYGAPYAVLGDDVPVAPDDGYYDDRGAPDVVYAPPREQVQPIGRSYDRRVERRYVERGPVRGGYVETHPQVGGYTTTTSSYGAAGGYVANGYYYPPATVTTVTVGSPTVTTTTTTEEIVTYSSPRTVKRRATYRARPSKTLCRC